MQFCYLLDTEEEEEEGEVEEAGSTAPTPTKKKKGLLPTLLTDLGRKRKRREGKSINFFKVN